MMRCHGWRNAPTPAAALDAVRRLQALTPYPSQIELWAKVSDDIIPRNGTKVTDWVYQAGQLEFTVSAPTGVDAPNYIKAFQAVARLR